MKILDQLVSLKAKGQRSMAILVDPEKTAGGDKSAFAKAITARAHYLTESLDLHQVYIFVGGSTMPDGLLHNWLKHTVKALEYPTIIFPGDYRQVSHLADALLFLNLISGDNPDYLIGHQRSAARNLKGMDLEIIPTSYLLLDGGTTSAVERVTGTKPLPQKNITHIVDTTIAGGMMGHQLIYLEAGSGARVPVSPEVISAVCKHTKQPIITGGGLRKLEEIELAYQSGATLAVVGTAIEEDPRWEG